MTNNHDMPSITIDWFSDPKHVFTGRADYSATTLIQSPRQVRLHKRHRHEVETDIRDSYLAKLGNILHEDMERKLKHHGYATEAKLTEVIMGRKLVAIVDAYKDGVVYDHKTTKCGNMGTTKMKPEWEQQLNINSYMLRKQGVPADLLAIHLVYLDWKPTMAKLNKDYPQSPTALLTCTAWSFEEQDKFIRERLTLHKANEDAEDAELPHCTMEERWENPPQIAVTRQTGSCAKLCSTEEEAEAYIKMRGLNNVKLVHRPSQRTKCKLFCDYAHLCNQYKEYLDEEKADKQRKQEAEKASTGKKKDEE